MPIAKRHFQEKMVRECFWKKKLQKRHYARAPRTVAGLANHTRGFSSSMCGRKNSPQTGRSAGAADVSRSLRAPVWRMRKSRTTLGPFFFFFFFFCFFFNARDALSTVHWQIVYYGYVDTLLLEIYIGDIRGG